MRLASPWARVFLFVQLSFFLNADSSFEVTISWSSWTTPNLGIKNLEVRLQLCLCDSICRLQIGNSLRGFNLAHPSLLQWDHLHTRTSILKFIRQIPNFLKSGQASSSSLSVSSSLESCVSLHWFWLLHRNIRTLCGCPGITRMCSTVRTVWHGQASGNVLRQNKSAPPLQLRWYHQYPLLQYLRQQIQAGFLPQASTAALAKDFPTLAHTVWSSGWQQKLLQRGCNWGTSHLDLSKLWEIFPLSSEEDVLVEYSFLVFRLQAFLSTKDFAQLAV